MFNRTNGATARRSGILIATAVFTVTGAFAATSAENSRFINQAYQDLLGRPADRVALTAYSHFLGVGGSRTQVAAILTGSSEYKTRLVQQFYEDFLHRTATTNEASFGVSLLQHGGTDDQLRSLILASQEYFNLAGGTNEGFLTKLFQDVLGRPIDRFTMSTLIGLLGNGYTRGMIADLVLKSLECDQRLVQQFYQKFLRRPADPAGLAAYTQILQNGIKEEVVVDSLIGSDEYFKLANQ